MLHLQLELADVRGLLEEAMDSKEEMARELQVGVDGVEHCTYSSQGVVGQHDGVG